MKKHKKLTKTIMPDGAVIVHEQKEFTYPNDPMYFRLHTTIIKDRKIISVSTAGDFTLGQFFETLPCWFKPFMKNRYSVLVDEIGYERYYETMIFYSDRNIHHKAISEYRYCNKKYSPSDEKIEEKLNKIHKSISNLYFKKLADNYDFLNFRYKVFHFN